MATIIIYDVCIRIWYIVVLSNDAASASIHPTPQTELNELKGIDFWVDWYVVVVAIDATMLLWHARLVAWLLYVYLYTNPWWLWCGVLCPWRLRWAHEHSIYIACHAMPNILTFVHSKNGWMIKSMGGRLFEYLYTSPTPQMLMCVYRGPK